MTKTAAYLKPRMGTQALSLEFLFLRKKYLFIIQIKKESYELVSKYTNRQIILVSGGTLCQAK